MKFDLDYGDYGLIPRDYNKVALGSMEFAAKMDTSVLIPRDQWPDLISTKAAKKERLSDLADWVPIPCLNQGSVGYCHAFSPAYACMLVRAQANLPFKLLSASSVGGPVTGFRNAGAYIFDDLKQIVNYGICDVDHYPMLTTANKWTAEAQANAAQHKITEWWDLQNRNFDQVATCLLLNIPVCVGLNWWGHAVTYLDLVMLGKNQYGILIQNSWGESWEDGGRVIYPEGYGRGRSTPDESYAPRIIMAA